MPDKDDLSLSSEGPELQNIHGIPPNIDHIEDLHDRRYCQIWGDEIERNGWTFRLEGGALSHEHSITIVDIASNGDLHEWQIHGPSENTSRHEWLKASRAALDHQGCEARSRVIVFEQHARYMAQELVGLHYHIEPVFFRDIAQSLAVKEDAAAWAPYDHSIPLFMVDTCPDYLDLGYGWHGKIVNLEIRDEASHLTNVVIISAATRKISPAAAATLYRNDAIGNPDPHTLGPVYTYVWRKYEVDCAAVYMAALRRCLPAFLMAAHANPLSLVLPVLEIHTSILYGDLGDSDRRLQVGRARQRHLDHVIEQSWDALRMMKHEGSRPFDCFRQYDRDHCSNRMQSREEYQRLLKKFRRVMEQVNRIEVLAKDQLQAQIGRLSLEESRASIKQSRIALEESRRIKLINVLAFFFIPISLGTSVFGMNLSELNNNGQPLWIFIVTTISIFGVSTMVWAMSYQVYKYNGLPRDGQGERRRYGGLTLGPIAWHVRLYLFVRLVLRGRLFWIWQSGIVFALLTNGKVGFIKSCSDHETKEFNLSPQAPETSNMRIWARRHAVELGKDHVHSPCSYIATHLDLATGFECKKLEFGNST